jgi:para-aminobenzoate synthetase / 4-amino-4-deoxychorismate lyase
MLSPIAETARCPNSVLLVTSRRAHESRKSYLFTNPEYTFTLTRLEDLPLLYAELDAAAAKGLYAAGYMGYECGYANEPSLLKYVSPEFVSSASTPLAWFGFYRTPHIFDYIPETSCSSNVIPPETTLEISQEDYFRKFEKIKHHIKSGNTYQVNLTTRLTWSENIDPAALFNHIMAVQPVEFGAFIHLADHSCVGGGKYILSASPELFFRRLGAEIITRPMKGTAPRGFSVQEQQVNAQWLEHDDKNRSENVMIVDLLRNDLRRICQVNTVHVSELCAIEQYPTVLQMVSTIQGKLVPRTTYADIFRRLFPCGSITGAPKVRTMEIIHDLEDKPRGVYTGSIGFISPHEEAVFSVAIRTMVCGPRGSEMGIGGGIVWDSDAREEFDECRLKGSFLNRSSEKFDIIETLLWDGDRYVYLEGHVERLLASAEYFEYPCQEADVRKHLEEEAQKFIRGQAQRVRLLLSNKGKIAVTSTTIPQTLSNGTTNPEIKVLLSSKRTNSNDLFLRHKTTRRALYDHEFKNALSKAYDDAIFLNTQNAITECAIHNLFIVKNGQWITPPISDGLLPGVLRASLLQKNDMLERTLGVRDLVDADEIYLGNSVRGLRKVSRIDEVEGDMMVPVWEARAEKG